MPTLIFFISIAVLYLVFFYVFEIFQYSLLVKINSLFLALFVYYVGLYHVTYNSDWDMYYSIFMGYTQSNDFLFNLISQSFSDNGYEYTSVYKLHVFLIGIGFFYFASRNSYANVFGIIATYLLFQLVPVSNQIRYYLAFSFFMIAIYNFIVLRNIVVFIVFAALSLISHSAIFLMYPFIYFYYFVENESYLRKIIIYSFILAGIFYFISFLGFIFSFHFGSYFEDGFLSSFSGGLFNNFIWFIWFVFIYLLNKRLMKSNSEEIVSDVMYQFLYKISLYSILFLPVSIVLQILASRYIIASLIFWLLFYFYTLNYEDSLKSRLLSISLFILLIMGTFFYMYILPTYLLGISTTEALFEIFLSNKYFFSTL